MESLVISATAVTLCSLNWCQMSSLALCFPQFQPLKLCFPTFSPWSSVSPPLSAPLLICRGSMSPQVWEGFRDTFGPQSDKTADITQGEKPQYLTKKAWQFIFPPNCAARLWSLHWPRNKWKSFDILCRSQFGQIFSISVKQFVFTSTLKFGRSIHARFFVWNWIIKKLRLLYFSGKKLRF